MILVDRWLGPTPRDRRVALAQLAIALVIWPLGLGAMVYEWVRPIRTP